jgi:hypothetical protein
MKTDQRRWMLLAALVVVVAIPLMAQFGGRRFGGYPPGMGWADESVRAEMFFTRLAYSDYGGGRRRWGGGSWTTDWPDAEYHLMNGVKRLTMIDAAHGGRYARPSDDELFEYPWIYAVEVGNWYLDEDDAANLREYLLRGGFLMVDDFHGGYEWTSFAESMRRVFPDRPIIEIPQEDPVLHVLYDLDQRTQIPGIAAAVRGLTYERADGKVPFWRGIYDDEQRLMVAINFNMDLGDAWEHADDPRYPEPMTALAYRFGINYIVYAMTH